MKSSIHYLQTIVLACRLIIWVIRGAISRPIAIHTHAVFTVAMAFKICVLCIHSFLRYQLPPNPALNTDSPKSGRAG